MPEAEFPRNTPFHHIPSLSTDARNTSSRSNSQYFETQLGIFGGVTERWRPFNTNSDRDIRLRSVRGVL